MATTFFAENQPFKKVESKYFDPSQPEHEVHNPRYELEPEWPSREVSATNIYPFLQLTGLLPFTSSEETVGKLEVDQLHELMRRLIKLISQEKARQPMVKETHQEGIIIYSGTSDERIHRYITGLMEVVSVCIEYNRRLIWA